MSMQDKDTVKALKLETAIVNLYETMYVKMLAEISRTLFETHGALVSHDYIKQFIESQVVSKMSDVSLLDAMIADCRKELYSNDGAFKQLAHEDKMEYMSMILNMLRTKHKIVGIDKGAENTIDADAIKLQNSLKNAGIAFVKEAVKIETSKPVVEGMDAD